MKKILFVLSVFALALASCSKTINEDTPQTVRKVFSVSTDDTRTTLDGVSIKWSSTDRITVIAATSGNEYDFELLSGDGETAADFTGEIDAVDANETVFYAVYPNIKNNSVSDNVVTVGEAALGHTVLAVKDGFDPAFAVMAAKSENGQPFVFKHGMAYFKLEIAETGVSKVKVSVDGNERIFGRPIVDVTDVDGSSMDKGKKEDNYIEMQPESGTIVPGVYFIPVTTKVATLGNLTVEYTKEGKTASITTSKMSSKKLAAGKIFDLGCPPVSFAPVISFVAPAKLSYDATSGSVSFTVKNPIEGQSVTASLEEGVDWISNLVVGNETVTFNCEKNDAADAEDRTAVITLSYEGASSVSVTISQGVKMSEGSHVRMFYANNKNAVETLDGTTVTSDKYFTTDWTIISSWQSDYATQSATIDGVSYTQAFKLESKTSLSFTTSSSLNTTLRFYAVRRKTGDSARIDITGSSTQSIYPEHTSVTDSGSISLEKGVTYTIKQGTKESAVFLVVITETE